MGIKCDARFGLEDELKTGRAGHSRRKWGSLAPNNTDVQKSAPCSVAFLCVFANQNAAKRGADLCTRVKPLEADVPITDAHIMHALEQKKGLHIEISAGCSSPGGKAYRYAMSGNHDGWRVFLHG